MIKLRKKNFVSFKKSFDSICASGKSPTVINSLAGQRNEIEARVLKYLNNRRALENVFPAALSPDISVELKSCYDGMPSDLKFQLELSHKYFLRGLHVCPYCLISEADTKDHYLPKEDFPEFSFLSYNLIPCCANCNRRKGRQFLKDGRRLFFNPYFDSVPGRILDVELSLARETVSFHLVEKDSLLASHVEKLNIIERYNDKGAGVLSEIIYLLNDYPSMRDEEEFVNHMDVEYNKSKSRYGINHYTSLIYEKLLLSGLVGQVLQDP